MVEWGQPTEDLHENVVVDDFDTDVAVQGSGNESTYRGLAILLNNL